MSANRDDVLAAMVGGYNDFYLQFTPLKPDGGELRGPCPLHGGQQSNFAVNPEDGRWYCHSRGCGKPGGDVFGFIELMKSVSFPDALAEVAAYAGVSDLPTSPRVPRPLTVAPANVPPPVKYLDIGIAEQLHENLMQSEKVRRWLSEVRGLSAETLTRFRIGLTRPAAKGEEWRITFPVLDREGQLINIRKHLFAYKPDLTEERRRELGKTKPWEAGLTAGLFPLSALKEGANTLLLEGECDALLANQMGFAAVSNTGGAGMWKPELTEIFRSFFPTCVTLLYDGDEAGKNGAQKAAAALASVLPDVHIASLPDGEDFTSWVMDKGATAADVQQAIDQAISFVPAAVSLALPVEPHLHQATVEPKTKPPARKSLAERLVDMADIGPPPTELPLLWWVLTEKMTHWLSAPSGAGKTTLAFNIVTALAEGTTLWGKETTRPIRTVYVDMESGEVVQQTKLLKLYQDTPRVRDGLLFLNDIQLPAELPELVAVCQARQVDLVVFDTAAKTWNLRDENDNSEVGRSITPVLETLKRAGIATLVIDHTGKNGVGARGASAKAANVDVVLDVDVRGEGESAVVQINCPKHKLLGFPPPLILKRIGNDQFERVNAEDAGSAEETASRQVQCHQFIKEALEASDVPLTHGNLLKMALEAGFSKSTFGLVWKSMKHDKTIVADEDGYTLDPFAD